MLDQLRTYTSYTFTHAPALKLECWHKCMHASVCAYSTCTRHTCTSVHALTQTHTHRHIGTCGSRTRVCTYMRTHANTRTRAYAHTCERTQTHARTYSRGRTRTRTQVPGSHARTRVRALPYDLNGHAQPRLQAPNALQQRRCGARHRCRAWPCG
jgi:hypothetical protein